MAIVHIVDKTHTISKHHFLIRDSIKHDTDELAIMDNVVAVCGLKSSGGLAILDWLDDYGNVVGSMTENRYVSGRYGLKNMSDIQQIAVLKCEQASKNTLQTSQKLLRVMILNRTTGKALGNYEVKNDRFEFSWRGHNIRHKLKYKFQSRQVDDSEWTDIGSFQRIAPPMKNEHQLLEFIRTHAIGATVPLNRGVARLMMQYWEDVRSELSEKHKKSTIQALKHEHCHHFIKSYLEGNWTNILEHGEEENSLLLIRKMFTQGRLEMLKLLPPFHLILVWRDPRDQYADRVRKKYGIAEGDVKGFVEWYWTVMGWLSHSLKMCSDMHRANIIHIPFGRFVLDEEFRDNLAKKIGVDISSYLPHNFIASESSMNVGFWKDWSKEEIEYLEEQLSPVINFCTDLKPFNLSQIQEPNTPNPDGDDSALLISCNLVT